MNDSLDAFVPLTNEEFSELFNCGCTNCARLQDEYLEKCAQADRREFEAWDEANQPGLSFSEWLLASN